MTTPRAMRVGVVQHCATPDVDANLARIEALSQRARDAGAEAVFLPEAFAYLGPDRDRQAILEPLPEGGPILDRCRALANDLGCDVVLGGFHEQGPTEGKAFNTCVHLDGGGAIVACYRKIHLFDVDLADGTKLHESKRTAPGDALVTTELAFGTLGLTICYDVRFPALYQSLVERGAVALTVPSAFTAATGPAHWHALLRARAIECQSYVIAPAQHGHNWGKRHSYGHSVIIDPWGVVVAEIEDGDGYAVAEIDPHYAAEVRQQLPSLQHKRPFR